MAVDFEMQAGDAALALFIMLEELFKVLEQNGALTSDEKFAAIRSAYQRLAANPNPQSRNAAGVLAHFYGPVA